MALTNITRSVAYQFYFWNNIDLIKGNLDYRGKDRFVVYLTERFKTRTSPNLLLVFGPGVQGCPIWTALYTLQQQQLAKMLWSSNTGHGGNSTLWVIYNPLKINKPVKKITKKKDKTT